MVALAMASLSTVAFAQQAVETVEVVEVPTKKYSVETNGFWNNWFIQANAAYSAFYSSDGTGAGKNPFKNDNSKMGFTVAAGRWFTPGLGLRLKFNGPTGSVVLKDSQRNIDYWAMHGDVLFNFSNLFCGYTEKRVYNASPYLGAGFARNCTDNN